MPDESREGRRPNFFIIGAQKCGTTSLHSYLAQHPDVFMSDPKEPGHFVPEMDYYPKDLAWYLSLFAGAGDARIVGESSTHYTKMPVYSCAADKIAEFSPDARVVYLMRDPIRRAISHYWHSTRLFDEARPMLKAIQEDVQYCAFGDYAMQLEPWLERFDRRNILVLVFEDMVADPETTLSHVLRWLELPELPVPLSLERENARPDELLKARGRGLLSGLRYSGMWGKISPRVPQGLKDWAKGFAVEKVRPEDQPVDEVIDYLRPWAKERIAARLALMPGPRARLMVSPPARGAMTPAVDCRSPGAVLRCTRAIC